MQMYNKAGRGNSQGNQIRVTMPYVRAEIPVIIVFRALGWPLLIDSGYDELSRFRLCSGP